MHSTGSEQVIEHDSIYIDIIELCTGDIKNNWSKPKYLQNFACCVSVEDDTTYIILNNKVFDMIKYTEKRLCCKETKC